jgi:hypothetical protein
MQDSKEVMLLKEEEEERQKTKVKVARLRTPAAQI